MEKDNKTQLIRLVAAGSVDDGKSTLIGRLLYDTDSVSEDQLEAARAASDRRGHDEIDLSLLTDGLAAEREQGITIDVAYRYFSLPERRFIIADVPGHEQYTRNMVTGASTADIGILLVDASQGLTEQSKRHLSIASLLGIPHIVMIINKMDLVDYSESEFEQIKEEITNFAAKLNIQDLQYIPVSALEGDMVVERGDQMNWYNGPTVLSYLENIAVTPDRNLVDFRLPVQYVLNNEKGRGYSGRIASGSIKQGEEIIVLPSNKKSKVEEITVAGEEKEKAQTSESASIYLEDELDISRGDMISRVGNQPIETQKFQAQLCWMNEENLDTEQTYLLKHTGKTTRCDIDLQYKLNIDSLHREEAESLKLNEIGKVSVTTHQTIMMDPYEKNRNTGNFILIDDQTKNTVGGGMIIQPIEEEAKEKLSLKDSATLWFTGLSGAGKSTIADKLKEELEDREVNSQRLDGDILRDSICSDLGFSEEDRRENIKRAGFVAKLLSQNGVLTLASFITPYKDQRKELKEKIGDKFIEVFVDAPLEVCEERDVKGLYQQARDGEIDNFTGISHPYEKPDNPDIHIRSDQISEDEAVDKILTFLKEEGFLT
ncbi:MAG: adenylyl-sulfate kinase [Candidatus Magasanikbacteria bacterium]